MELRRQRCGLIIMEAMNNVLFRHCTERVIDAINIGSMELVNLKQN